MTQWCPECRLVVAPFATDRRAHNGVFFHASCLVKYLLRIDFQRRIHRPIKAP